MKILQVAIENFRCINSGSVNCENFNSFVGPNGSGKSTVLHALNVFFGEVASFSDDDFHKRDTSRPIKIQVTFHELGEAASEEFKHYVRSGKLVVQAEINRNADGTFKRTIRGERYVFEPFRPFFEASTATERGKIYKELCSTYPDIQAATNDEDRRRALSLYEENLPEKDKALTVSGAEFFGASKGVHKFQRHICWVYVPAVKDASSESEEVKSSHLGKLIQHTVRAGMSYEADLAKIRQEAMDAYAALLASQQSHLTDLQKRLSARLQAAVTAETGLALDWKKDEKSVAVQDPVARVLLSDRGFSGEVEKFGHGLQRSFLLVILQELMAVDSAVTPTLILACEEPELYQHPPQARHLASILMELSKGDAQVLITTHSPYFIDVENFGGIKMFRNVGGAAVISHSSFANILTGYNTAFARPVRNEDQVRTKLAIQTQPKFNEIFFAEKVVLVEGISDQACIETYLQLSGLKLDFQKSGTSIVICEGKSSLALMLLIANDFKIPVHVVFDCDSGSDAKYHADHVRDNDAILVLSGLSSLAGFPSSHILEKNVTGWLDTIEQVLEEEYAGDSVAFNSAGSNAVGYLKSCKKNPIYIAAAMAAAWHAGRRFPILETVVRNVLS